MKYSSRRGFVLKKNHQIDFHNKKLERKEKESVMEISAEMKYVSKFNFVSVHTHCHLLTFRACSDRRVIGEEEQVGAISFIMKHCGR